MIGHSLSKRMSTLYKEETCLPLGSSQFGSTTRTFVIWSNKVGAILIPSTPHLRTSPTKPTSGLLLLLVISSRKKTHDGQNRRYPTLRDRSLSVLSTWRFFFARSLRTSFYKMSSSGFKNPNAITSLLGIRIPCTFILVPWNVHIWTKL